MMRVRALVLFLIFGLVTVRAQGDTTAALRFFLDGGAYCARVVPEGVALSEETGWTVMLLTSATNRNNSFRIRSVAPGRTGLSGQALRNAGIQVIDVWRADATRGEFFEKFARAIDGKALRARVVKMGPANLAQMPALERADAYLKFADRGSKVSFDKVTDLSADAFREYARYLPD